MVVLGNEQHIVDRLRERISDEIANSWLYNLLNKINNYIPDDWRLSEHSNEFIIRVIGKYEATFVGHSIQTYEIPEHTYHIIDTVLWPGGFAKGEFPSVKCPKCGQEIKHEVPQSRKAARPNLYVLEDSPENWFFSLSPLAARQYVKTNPQQYGFQEDKINLAEHYEYHRVHPLYKSNPLYKLQSGIQKEVFVWIKWYYDGKLEWKNIIPENDWRGESFWNTEMQKITKQEQREIMRNYLEGLRRYT